MNAGVSPALRSAGVLACRRVGVSPAPRSGRCGLSTRVSHSGDVGLRHGPPEGRAAETATHLQAGRLRSGAAAETAAPRAPSIDRAPAACALAAERRYLFSPMALALGTKCGPPPEIQPRSGDIRDRTTMSPRRRLYQRLAFREADRRITRTLCENQRMSEDLFTDRLSESLCGRVAPHELARKRSLLYDMAIDDRGL
jgi:hypothetical protein